MRRSCLLVVCIVVMVCAAIPRFVSIEHPGMTQDEQYDLVDAVQYSRDGCWSEPVSDGFLNGQFLFYLTDLMFEAGFSKTESTPRLISALLGVCIACLTVLLSVLVFRSLIIALFTGLSVSFSCYMVSSSRLAFSHGHVGAVPFLLLAYALVALAWRSSEQRDRLLLSLFAMFTLGMAVGTDILALPFVLIPGVLALVGAMRVSWAGGKSSRRIVLMLLSALSGLVGIGLTSPMLLASPVDAVRNVWEHMAFWNDVTGYVWLGSKVSDLPWYYYLVVLCVRIEPWILILFAASVALLLWHLHKGKRPWAFLFLLSSSWVVVYLSLKGWKSPFYLSPFVPVIYVAAMYVPACLLRSRSGMVRWLTGIALLVGLTSQVARVVHTHPAYLMDGIQYSDRLYGQFQGPAVDHGQWIKEGLEAVQEDSGGRDFYLVPFENAADVGTRQLEYYMKQRGIQQVHSFDEYLGLEKDLRDKPVYFITHYSAVDPAFASVFGGAGKENRPLYEFVNSAKCRKVASLGHPAFSTVEVYTLTNALRALSDREAQEVVRTCYSEVLCREPDEHGLAYYSEQLKDGKDGLWLKSALRESGEYERRLGRRNVRWVMLGIVLIAIAAGVFVRMRGEKGEKRVLPGIP